MTPVDLAQTLSSFLPPNQSTDGLYASLRHGGHQRPIAWSSKNVAIVPSWVPDRKVPGLMNPSLRLLSLLMSAEGKAKLWDTCLEDISMFHGQSNITQVLWNHSGSYFATMDEKGKIVIWANKRYLNAWLPVYMVVLFNPVVCCEWINPDRMYVASKTDGSTRYERERTGRSRNPLSLVVLTSDGLLTTLYKPAGQLFTTITTPLPRRSIDTDMTSSRISHGSMMSGADGIYLATHASQALPSTIHLYQIDLRFSPEAVFRCDALAVLHITTPLSGPGSTMSPSIVQHLQLLPPTLGRPFSVAVALASRDELTAGSPVYKSQVAIWDVAPKLMGFHPAFQELSTRRTDGVSGQPTLTFVLLGERLFSDKFISAMTFVPRSRELVLGFSDGSILGIESRFSGLTDMPLTWLDGFSREVDGCPMTALQPSPNGLHLLCTSLSGHIFSLSTSSSPGYGIDLEALVQQAVVAVLNESDYSDIISVVVAASKDENNADLADQFMEGVLKSYDSISGAEDTSTLEPFLPRASVLRRMLSLQLVLFQALPSKIVQYRAICAFMHLQSIGEVFSGCCTSGPLVAEHLDPNANIPIGQKQLSFETDSLWSLLPLCGWTLDFCTLLFRELAVFLNMKSASTPGSPASDQQSVPDGQSPPTLTEGTPKPSLLCFLYHSRARRALRSVLLVMEQFQLYVKNREQLFVRVFQSQAPIVEAAGPDQDIKSMTVQEAISMKEIQITHLSQYVEMTFSRCSLKVDFVKSLLRDLNSIGGQASVAAGVGVLDKSASDHSIFIKGVIPTLTTKMAAQTKTDLRNMTRRYPTLWNMNKLMFATLHWLELEPTNTLTDTRGVRNRAAAMHPVRCRIDPVAALKPRGASTLMAGRHSVQGLHHLPSNVSNASLGSRGSISSASGTRVGIQPKIFSESPGELPLSQQSNQQPRYQSFGDSSSTMAITGSVSYGGPFDFQGSSFSFASSLWGLMDDERRYSKDEQGSKNDSEDQEALMPAWQSWSENGQHQSHRSQHLSNGHGAEIVPDDDQQAEEEAEEEDEYMDSDEDMRESSAGGGSRRNSKVGSHLPSSVTTKTPWLQREAKLISRKTRSEWTLLPVLSDERSSSGMERSDVRGGRLAMLGLSGHFAPVDLQPTEFQVFSQSEIEAQVRKRRYGNDPIRKVKKFKAIGNGRQCIRCLQTSTTNSGVTKVGLPRRSPTQAPGTSPTGVDITSATIWYHNYDRACICGGMWLEL
ncbi:hypothetical protein EMPS_09067 [Entomortierella parvispora]|uniref:Mediator complex subunit 16 n=1 Tax=Entomortierella parvispora TaxID=205924 RepID=A0A9P3HHK1_9FUNG|nr:hypothetical protein EMPS_09067 [Entomortierella parvispora]